MFARIASWTVPVAGLVAMALAASAGFADEAPMGSDIDDAQRVANRIDHWIEQRWQADAITAAPLAEDAEFFRRANLDLCGRIPAGSEVRDFLADSSPDKRRAAIERMLASPTYVVNATNRWRSVMLPEADSEQEVRFVLPGFEAWLRSRIAENRNYAEIAREILALPAQGSDLQTFSQPERPSPAAFYVAKQGKPENLGASTSRLFLGVRIECAQCHDHPFDAWKQDQFWGYAAFFAEFQSTPGEDGAPAMVSLARGRHALKIPDSDRTVEASFLNGDALISEEAVNARERLADWITSPRNPWFARVAANRIWTQLFGTGLVDPADDFGPNNPPSHPELLNELADQFVAHDYNFKFLIRAITLSRTYQRSSQRTDSTQDDPRTFARMPARAMSPEQIFDSLAQATGYLQPFDPEKPLNFNDDAARQEFLETFANDSQSTTERQSTILQALTLMNGMFVSAATDVGNSQTLTAVAEAPFLDVPQRIEALFLATLSRSPRPAEISRFRDYVESAGDAKSSQALADVFWALLNSGEFAINH